MLYTNPTDTEPADTGTLDTAGPDDQEPIKDTGFFSGGCGCASAQGSASLLGLLALGLVRRRR